MPICNTHTFWNYIINEPKQMIDKIIESLTRNDYNFDTKTYDRGIYYQIVPSYPESVVLRYPAGLTKYLCEKLPLEIENKPTTLEKYTLNDVLKIAEEVKLNNPHFEVREYQLNAVLATLNNFQSLIYSSVGSGKSSVMSLVCKVLKNDRILIMNDNDFILKQIYDRLRSFNITDVSFNPGKDPDYSKRIIIFNTASSNSRIKRKNIDYLTFLQDVECYITDESQGIQALTWFEPIMYMNEDKLKRIVGYSGSPFRNYKFPYNDPQDFRTIAILGEPAFTYEMKDTIADGNIAQPYSYFINFPNKPAYVPEKFKDNYFMQYKMNITYNKARNKAGLEMLKFLNKNKIATLASFNNIKPAQNMMKDLKIEGIDALFICGDKTIYEWVYNKRGTLKLEEREGTPEDIKVALENGYNIIFGSVVMDRGVDVELFQATVLFSAGKTPISGIQRIGRSARKRKYGQNISFVIDFRDINGYPTFRTHYEQRKELMLDSGVKNLENVHEFIKMIEMVNAEKQET